MPSAAVFAELKAAQPEDVRYLTLRLDAEPDMIANELDAVTSRQIASAGMGRRQGRNHPRFPLCAIRHRGRRMPSLTCGPDGPA